VFSFFLSFVSIRWIGLLVGGESKFEQEARIFFLQIFCVRRSIVKI